MLSYLFTVVQLSTMCRPGRVGFIEEIICEKEKYCIILYMYIILESMTEEHYNSFAIASHVNNYK